MTDRDFYRFESVGARTRVHPCVLCAAGEGEIVGRMDYIGLGVYDVLQCPTCGLASFDPMPSVEITVEGCERFSRSQARSRTRGRIARGRLRAYRRGGFFARNVMRDFFAAEAAIDMLEIGAGSGYFSQGVKQFYPRARVHYNDIVPGKVEACLRHFDCEGAAGEFTAERFPGKRFDLVIARDVLEHLRDPAAFLRDVAAVLRPGGLLYFITPNGRENLWESNQRLLAGADPCYLDQNHYHYFLPQVLDRLLDATGLERVRAFKWGLSGHRKGLGWKRMRDFPPSPRFDPAVLAEAPRLAEDLALAEMGVPAWRLDLKAPWARLYSQVVDRYGERVDFYAPEGREFFVLARKPEECP